MRLYSNTPSVLVAAALFGFGTLFEHSAHAQVFNLDTNQSYITISGTILGNQWQEQGPGSLTTKYKGTLRANVTGSTIQFTGQSLLEGFDNGSWAPKADGTSGSEPANYGGQASSLLGSAKAALRKIQLDVVSPSLTITNGRFASGSLAFFFPTNAPSTLAYSISSFLGSQSGSVPLVGYATNNVTTLATLGSGPAGQTLTIPVDSQFFFSLLSDNDVVLNLKGQLLATQSTQTGPSIDAITVRTQLVTLRWQSTPNQVFQVQSTEEFKTWSTNATNITSTTADYSWSGLISAAKAFFRLAR